MTHPRPLRAEAGFSGRYPAGLLILPGTSARRAHPHTYYRRR